MDDIASRDQPAPDEFVGLHDRLARMEGEIDDLKKAADKPEAPWFRNPSVLLSFCALLFSFGTTAVSYVRTSQQEIHDSRTELRALIQRLNRLPVENVENEKKYADDQPVRANLSGILNTENALVAKQAADITDRIPKHVGATEYLAVANALSQSNLTAKALALYKSGLNVANDANDDVNLLRAYGGLLFLTGNIEKGREQYRAALAIYTKYSENNIYMIESTHFLTEASWANAELFARQCGSAKEHFDQAERHLSNPQVAGRFKGQLEAIRPSILICTF